MPPTMSRQSSLCTWGCRRLPCAPAPRIRSMPANSMTALCLCGWSSRLSCWPLCVDYSGLPTYRRCRPFGRWRTSSPSSLNCSPILHRKTIWSTCVSNCSTSPAARSWAREGGRQKFKKQRFQMIANTLGSSSLRFLATKALQVLGAVNLLSPYESAAFHDALQNDDAVSAFFTSLLNVVDANPLSPRIFDEYVEAVTSLPADRGRVATWPVATVR